MHISSMQICKDLRSNRVNIASEKMMDYLSLTLSSATKLVIKNEYRGTLSIDYLGVADKLLLNDKFYLVLRRFVLLVKRTQTNGENVLTVNIFRNIKGIYQHYHVSVKIFSNRLEFEDQSNGTLDDFEYLIACNAVERKIISKLVTAINDYGTVKTVTSYQKPIPQTKIHEAREYEPYKQVNNTILLIPHNYAMRFKKRHLGGTHASPCEHVRRAHTRKYKIKGTNDYKLVEIKEMVVGTKRNGVGKASYIM